MAASAIAPAIALPVAPVTASFLCWGAGVGVAEGVGVVLGLGVGVTDGVVLGVGADGVELGSGVGVGVGVTDGLGSGVGVDGVAVGLGSGVVHGSRGYRWFRRGCRFRSRSRRWAGIVTRVATRLTSNNPGTHVPGLILRRDGCLVSPRTGVCGTDVDVQLNAGFFALI